MAADSAAKRHETSSSSVPSTTCLSVSECVPRQPKRRRSCGAPKTTPNSSRTTSHRMRSTPDWTVLPPEVLVTVFAQLPIADLGRVACVCKAWSRASQCPQLWQKFEFVLSNAAKSCLPATSTALINFVLKRHAKHLKCVILRTDSSLESAQKACHILSRLVNCSLKTLALMSSARPVFLDVDQESFVSALTLVLDHSRALSSLAIDNTPVDDPSLKALALSNSRTLQLLRMKSCPRVSPGGIVALADHCRCLRELSLSYNLLSDNLLMALSSEEHVRLEYLRIDIYGENDAPFKRVSPHCWKALVEHSPSMNLVMYVFVLPEESLESLFTSYIPVTHLYFGDSLPKRVLARIGKHCPRLRELVVGANGNTTIDSELLGVATNCPQLTSLGLGECEVTCSAFVEFVSRCGPKLRQLSVMEECLLEDELLDVNKTCKRVSEILGREWCPEFMPIW
ncbi:F-box/LRR-repeat protein 21-like isoform X2 [Neocloeon triangulifer]|uniref:F-box/LRR-repeat protein 21-like isoform X2 n=1 Tax=Neocloeon triangulifer TaxID=2078957 RepID=UPI00286EED49|nr:F-box/LRR-repeat protein 21-like isoform X2 [Neocloeon triangulifer]